MTKQWTIAKKHPSPKSYYHFQVWLDDTKTLPDGKPDPRYLMDAHWSVYPPDTDFTTSPPTINWKGGSINGTAYTDWESYIQAETQLLAESKLAELEATDTELSFQGTTFVT